MLHHQSLESDAEIVMELRNRLGYHSQEPLAIITTAATVKIAPVIEGMQALNLIHCDFFFLDLYMLETLWKKLSMHRLIQR